MGGIIVMGIIMFVLLAYMIKFSIDNSKNTQYIKEILTELQEIKAVLKSRS